MTPEEREIVGRLVITPWRRTPAVSKADFIQRFPAAIDHDRLATALLEKAEQDRCSDDLGYALIVGFSFGFDPRQGPIFCRLLAADWHHSHEDLVSALQKLRLSDRATIAALHQATQWVPSYLDFDESRALATKAIWALGKITGSEVEPILRELAASTHAPLRDTAQLQLERRKSSGTENPPSLDS